MRACNPHFYFCDQGVDSLYHNPKNIARASFKMTARTVYQDQSRAEQDAADDIGQPMHAANSSADDHESGKNGHRNDNGISERFIFNAQIHLHDRRRHNANDEHGRR
jgi:hypothetical protein